MDLGIADILVILFITIGPLKATIVYASLTVKADKAFKRAVAIKTVSTAAIVILLFVLAGEFILKVFHITLPALTLGGGLILLLFALHMVMGEEKKGEAEAAPSLSIAVYPLAMPLMATPQGIVAVVMIQAAVPGWEHILMLAGLCIGIMVFNLIVLFYADKIIQKIGPAALMVVGRVVGLLLVALAVQLLIIGFTNLGVLEAQVPH